MGAYFWRYIIFIFSALAPEDTWMEEAHAWLFVDAAARGISDLWTTAIIDLRISSWIMVTRRWKCNWRVFGRLGLGDFNDDKPLKGMRCVGWRGLQ